MNNQTLGPTKQILRQLVDELQGNYNDLLEPIHKRNPCDAYKWLYGAKNYYPLLQVPVVTRAVPSLYSNPVYPIFNRWLEQYLDIQNNDNYRIPNPEHNESVLTYINRLRSTIIDGNKHGTIWWSSLRSFMEFLRREQKYQMGSLGELEVLFPEKMMLYENMIIRKVPRTLYPIDIWSAAKIIQNLSKCVLDGRPNAQVAAARALGFVWVCLASSNAHCMTQLRFLYDLPLNSVKTIQQNDPFFPLCFLTIRTYFGEIKVPVSSKIGQYLLSLPRTNHHYVFEQSLRTLQRSLDRAISAANLPLHLGKISFLTFMHKPHEVPEYRHKIGLSHCSPTQS